jgi:outer membrane PBP1 activator LpoA protein
MELTVNSEQSGLHSTVFWINRKLHGYHSEANNFVHRLMIPRFYSIAVLVVLLFLLNACGTGSTKPVYEIPADQKYAGQTDISEGALQDEEDEGRQHPSDRSLAEVADLVSSMSGYEADVAIEVLRSLESVPSSQLRTMIEHQTQDPEFTEWLELSLQARSVLINQAPIATAAREWSDYHYGHAITREGFAELMALYREYFPSPAQVAILLPAEGGLASAARAIRDGILAAYLEQPGKSSIRFYSSGENSESAIAAYNQAIADGATQVIGPLRVESTRILSGVSDPEVPILLLNEPAVTENSDNRQLDNVTSLSLSQSEEAIFIANRAIEQGQKRAVMIVPNSVWGRRVETAFADNYVQSNGHISAITRFNASQGDHSAMLTKLLKIDESKQRKMILQSRIGNPLTFEPSRRDDFDIIFLAADPADGRELKPLLRFHDTGDIPVYAMGRVYSGKTQKAADQDLNGVVFPTTPWQLDQAASNDKIPGSVRGGTYGNLYALGQDAWRMLPWLSLMQKDPDLAFPGNVGTLQLQKDGRFYRQPVWAQFSGGQPISYQWPDIR